MYGTRSCTCHPRYPNKNITRFKLGWIPGLLLFPYVPANSFFVSILNPVQNSTYIIPKLPYPLRPLWITPSTRVFPQLAEGFLPLICVSASKVSSDDSGRSGGYTYVQGSGDDHELWGNGLTPEIFWNNKELLLAAHRGQLESVVRDVVEASTNSASTTPKEMSLIKAVGGIIGLCAISDLSKELLLANEDTAYVLVGSDEDVCFLSLDEDEKRILHLPATEGKRGHDQYLQNVLPQADQFIFKVITEGMKTCVACHTGNDLSVGVVLVALQRHFTDQGKQNTNSLSVGACIHTYCLPLL